MYNYFITRWSIISLLFFPLLIFAQDPGGTGLSSNSNFSDYAGKFKAWFPSVPTSST